MSDNGSQPTSKKFMKVAGTLGIQPVSGRAVDRQVFTSYNNPKGNANTERWFRTLKEDCIWVNEWHNLSTGYCVKETKKAVAQWIDFYNNQYVHFHWILRTALNGLSPNEFILQNSLKNAA